jgi:4'-phosphopantetheinyl transferase
MNSDTGQGQIIYPVILPVPGEIRDLKPKPRVTFLSSHARRALEISAAKSGIPLGVLKKNENGAPLPFDGTFWSVTHKTGYVGGVVARVPIGIDIEEIKSCPKSLFQKTAGKQEWSLTETNRPGSTIFFRYWTSKEAVLKACGTGIKDLLRCRIHRIIDDHHLEIRYQDRIWRVEHFFFSAHIASIVQFDSPIAWTFVKSGFQNTG